MFSPLFVRLSSSYFWYYAVFGLMIPFLAIYLDSKGLSSIEIGEILAVVTVTRVVGPTLWAILSDKTGEQVPIIKLGAILALCSFSFLLFFDSYWAMMFFLALFSLFWTAILPQIEVMTLTSIRQSTKIYARIRLWGSIGFIVFAVLSGEIIEKYSSQQYVYIGLFILICLVTSSFNLKQPRSFKVEKIYRTSIFSKLSNTRFLMFFFAGLLLQVSFGPFNGFFALYLRDLDYPGYAVGFFISIGVVAEIMFFIVAGKIFQRFEFKHLLIFCMLITSLRWWLTAQFGHVGWILALSQAFHAFSFGLYHAASMQFIQNHFNKYQQNRGQAIYIGGVYGIGGAIGAYLTGIVWQDGSGSHYALLLASAIALFATIFVLFMPKLEVSKRII